MKNLIKAVLLIGAVALSGCASTSLHQDIKTKSATAQDANLASYSSYKWVLGKTALHDYNKQWKKRNYDLDSELRFLINKELRERGLKENKFAAELGVVYSIGVDMLHTETVHDDTKNIDELKNVPKGGLVIALIDMKTRKAVWVGTASAAIQEGNNAAQEDERISYVVEKMFENYGE
ncbi:DUF4136 domain-containing protein [Ferrimonas lipolytica]|uniref:DUF4136 domain-containing protein n=1 Tax=Ferrimonas lipolytica TaxID=2724191 RepID=A0A6H1UAK1_9GAMM|nr:DUF4136 domain-containing protein [Ferrimonas lipolytica]QIZ75610.1 DUF4136 domain-containing protein [Ferrimonas lipolytica]